MLKIVFIALLWFLQGAKVAVAHPMAEDNLLRPVVRVISRAPIVLGVVLRPEIGVSSATVETPTGGSGGSQVKCKFEGLVSGQEYRCTFSASVNSSEPVISVVINGILVATDGHRHLSSRGFSVKNPNFDLDDFRAERRRESLESRSAGRVELVEKNRNRPH
jgi:hypothetical protein